MKGRIHYATTFCRKVVIGEEGGRPPISLKFYDKTTRRWIGNYRASIVNGEIVREHEGPLFDGSYAPEVRE